MSDNDRTDILISPADPAARHLPRRPPAFALELFAGARGFVTHPSRPVEETRWLQSIADEHGFPHGIVAKTPTMSRASGRSSPDIPRFNGSGGPGSPQLALAAVDIVLWDLKAKKAGAPLWKALGGATSPKLGAHNTDIGWLSIPTDELVEGCLRAIETEGYRRLKLKVGHDDPMVDLRRIEKVRRAVGDAVTIAMDGNGRWDLPDLPEVLRAG